MRRMRVEPRRDWKALVEADGLAFHTHDGGSPYWDESVCYEFSPAEINILERAASELWQMCLSAGDYIIENQLLEHIGIPAAAAPLLIEQWNSEPPASHGRFDLLYDGQHVKLLEFNADTPTALLEAAVVQWNWLESTNQRSGSAFDQWNSIHEKLIENWRTLLPALKGETVHFAHCDSWEDTLTTAYLREIAGAAGLKTEGLLMEQIGFNRQELRFVDLQEQPINTLYKLYPWEWLLEERFSAPLLEAMSRGGITVIEPLWRMLWSNKALLPILYALFPDSPWLLESTFTHPADPRGWVAKSFFGREGSEVYLDGKGMAQESPRHIWQRYFDAEQPGRVWPVLGVWMSSEGEPMGMGIREADGPITTNLSRFVPHRIA